MIAITCLFQFCDLHINFASAYIQQNKYSN